MINYCKSVETVISLLEINDYEAYIVGGCVRDFFLGAAQSDWDVATSAPPHVTTEIFKEYKCIDTGIKHGTVTVIIDGTQIEITTFRVDGNYTDNRRPDNVVFTQNLRNDLQRRDFTINAMAYNKKTGLIDYFGGKNDIDNKTLRCVGNATQRFDEDSLRILRGLRFSSVLGFAVETDTKKAMFQKKHLLSNISSQRIAKELCGMLCGNPMDILLNMRDIIGAIIPEVIPTFDFLQHNKYHNKDVWGHTVNAVCVAPPEKALRFTMLFHDLGKPQCFSIKDGTGHAYGHPKVSCLLAEQIMQRLKFDNKMANTILTLIKYHDLKMEDSDVFIKKWINKLGADIFLKLIKVHIADDSAKSDYAKNRIATYYKMEKRTIDIVNSNQCYTLKSLEVNGNDMLELGISGKDIGDALNLLLNAVIEGECQNQKQELIKYLGNNLKSS